MSKAIISDIDGTLLSNAADTAPEEVTNALLTFQQQGNYVGLCTGRALGGCQPIIKSLKSLNLPSIFFSGALIWDTNTNTEIFSQPLDESILEIIPQILANYKGVSVTVNTIDEAWTLRTNEILRNKATTYDRNTPVVDIDSINLGEKRLLKMLLTCGDPNVLKEIRSELLDPSLFHRAFASRHFFEVTDHTVDKGKAIEILKGIYPHLKNGKLWAAGDAQSDAPMRHYVNCFAAPEDAHPAVVELADYIFPSAKESGFVKFIDHLLE
ncbi:MAG: HAD family hydrolase [Sphaerochaetaceae bacterium]|jgi:Cof subfamily protein (haloacid dehalogenase superfamily)|nr:HAD family hydrolase [Sphaerochaetaceae bacterium]